MRRIIPHSLAALAALLCSLSAFAADPPTFDVTDVTAALTAGLTPVAAIGAGALVLAVVIGVWMKLRRPAR